MAKKTAASYQITKLTPMKYYKMWHASFDFILAGKPTHAEEIFIVAKTKNHKIASASLTDMEKSVIQKFKWFSIDEIKNCKEVIYPVSLAHYLPDILANKYHKQPIQIDVDNK